MARAQISSTSSNLGTKMLISRGSNKSILGTFMHYMFYQLSKRGLQGPLLNPKQSLLISDPFFKSFRYQLNFKENHCLEEALSLHVGTRSDSGFTCLLPTCFYTCLHMYIYTYIYDMYEYVCQGYKDCKAVIQVVICVTMLLYQQWA